MQIKLIFSKFYKNKLKILKKLKKINLKKLKKLKKLKIEKVEKVENKNFQIIFIFNFNVFQKKLGFDSEISHLMDFRCIDLITLILKKNTHIHFP